MTVKNLVENYKKPTPDRWVRVGKSISLLGTTLQVAIAGLVGSGQVIMPGHYFYWVIGIALIQWLGQTITDFTTDNGKV